VRRPGLDGSCWPDPDTEDVLRAALLPVPDAVEAWHRARASVDRRDDVLADRQRLLPLVLANIGTEGAGDDAPRMKRIHRESWRNNRLHVHHAPRWLDPLRDQVPVMLLKGMPLALHAYPDIGRRPMSDIDVLVPSPQFARAVELLGAAGWSGAEDWPLPRSWRARHGVPLIHPDGGHIDLHHAPGTPFMGHAHGGVAVPEMWAAQEPSELAERPVAVPAPEDLLLTVVVHGLTSVNGWSSRWVADAVVLLGRGEVDWDRFVGQARRYHVVLPARSAMRYLVDTFDAPVPNDALWELWAVPVGAGDRRRFDTVTGAVGADELWGKTSSMRGRWARLRTAVGPTRALLAAPRFAADVLHVEHAWQVPNEVVRRGRRRLAPEATSP
jgi:hypothetical protein